MLERFVVGVITAPFGIRGYVKVQVPSGETSHLIALNRVLLKKGSSEQSYEVEDHQGAPSSFSMKFKGIDTPEAARELQGSQIMVDRAQAAPLEEDEYYIEDLLGIFVYLGSPQGEHIGEITRIVEGGGGQLAEIRLGSGVTRLVPFRNEFFGDIDISGRSAILLKPWILE